MDLDTARRLALEIKSHVEVVTTQCEIAGSIRREKPEVKDIELVLIVSDYNAMFERVKKFGRFIKPGVPDVIDWAPKVGAKYLRVMTDAGIKLDMFIAEQKNWGPLYCIRTGSAAGPEGSVFNGFVPAMFKRWKKVSNGGKMTGGQPQLPNGHLISIDEEWKYFELLHVEWVEPRDRISAKAVKIYP